MYWVRMRRFSAASRSSDVPKARKAYLLCYDHCRCLVCFSITNHETGKGIYTSVSKMLAWWTIVSSWDGKKTCFREPSSGHTLVQLYVQSSLEDLSLMIEKESWSKYVHLWKELQEVMKLHLLLSRTRPIHVGYEKMIGNNLVRCVAVMQSFQLNKARTVNYNYDNAHFHKWLS